MSFLIINTRKDLKALKFFSMTKKRLAEKNLIRNPFKGTLKVFVNNNSLFIPMEMSPLYPMFYPYGLLLFMAALFITGFTWWCAPGIIIFFTGIFYSKYFFYLMMRIGLRKQGYKGYIKLLRNQEAVRRLLYGTD